MRWSCSILSDFSTTRDSPEGRVRGSGGASKLHQPEAEDGQAEGEGHIPSDASPDQVEAALTEGLGDIIAYGIVVTPDREKRVAFSTPIQTDVTQIIVTGSSFGPVSTLADLGGKEVYVNPLTTYYQNLQKVNETLQKAGKTPIVIKAADKNLMDDDLVQMVNAGLIPATVTTKQRADLWSQVLDHIQPHPDLVIASGRATGVGHAQEQPAIEAIGRRICRVARGGNILRQHPASPLPAKHQVGQEFNFGGGDEEVPGRTLRSSRSTPESTTSII